MTGDLQSYFQDAISIIDTNVILINIDIYNETVPKFESGGIRYNNQKNNNHSGDIIVIVLASVVSIGALIAALIICRKKTIKEHGQVESTEDTFNLKIKN